MYHERLARDLLGVYAGGVGEPVVGVDDVARNRAGYHSCRYAVVVDFLEQVVGIASRELDAAEVVEAHVVEIGVDVVAQAEVHLGAHVASDALFHVVARHVAPCHRHLRCAYYAGETAVFVAPRLRDYEVYFHVAALPHAACEAVACGAESAEDVRREFPAEH